MDAGFPAKMCASLAFVYQKAPIVCTPTDAAIARMSRPRVSGRRMSGAGASIHIRIGKRSVSQRGPHDTPARQSACE